MEKKRRLNSPDSSRINELSDDVLVLVLSKVTMKEAARTSTLSHRWKNLWVYYAGVLNFDNVDATFNPRRLSIERPRFLCWVNGVLNLLRGSMVKGVRVCFDLDASNEDDVEPWIMLAMEKKVSVFELDFSEFNGYDNNELYRFPKKLLGSFGSLTSLRLACVDLSDEVLAYLISNCKSSLEHLSIKRAASLTYLNATTALKLKHLEIDHCRRLKKVDISNTNIESVKFNGEWQACSSLENLHLLREVSLSGLWCPRVVRNNFSPLPISQLQRLELDMGSSLYSGVMEFPEVFPTLCNLKHLVVSLGAGYDQNIFCLTSLICASPRLSSFTLKVRYVKPSSIILYELPNCEWRNSEKRIHECLKVVKFIGWSGYKGDMDIVYYLIKKSVVLEKVIIDPKILIIGKRSASVIEEIENVSRDRAKLLQQDLPPGMELVIV